MSGITYSKSIYFIAVSDGRGGIARKLVSGYWFDYMGRAYGVAQDDKGWWGVTDLRSGYRIGSEDRSCKGAVEFATGMLDALVRADCYEQYFDSDTYLRACRDFEHAPRYTEVAND